MRKKICFVWIISKASFVKAGSISHLEYLLMGKNKDSKGVCTLGSAARADHRIAETRI